MAHTTLNGTPRPAPPDTAVTTTPHDLNTPQTREHRPPVSLTKPGHPETNEQPPTPTPAPDRPGAPAGGRPPRLVPVRRLRAAGVQAGQRAQSLARDDRTRTVLRAAVRHSLYLAGGTRIVARRAWHGRTVAVHHQMRAAAVIAGNHELAAEWQEKADRFRSDRHRRRMELIAGVPQMAKATGITVAAGEGALLLLGACMAVHDHQVHDVIAPTLAVVDAVRALCWFVGVAWGPALALALLMGLSHLWRTGQRQQTAPAWARPATGVADDVPVTPSVVVKALSDLGISPLRKAIKEMADGAAGMLGPITLAGCGVEVDVTLPSGVSTEEVLNRRRKLAENLNRHEHELHMTIPPAPRTVRMWIADSGALDQPIGPSPLVTDPDATADMQRGRAPWGVDLRGDAVLVSLWQKHMLVTGLSNQGKTASLRALALWLALDARVEFRIADLKGVGDWQMFDGIATTLIQGPTDDHVIEATEMLEEAVQEMAARIALMRELTAKGWSQDRILADPRFNPLVLLIDEAQVAYGSGARETIVTETGTVRQGAPFGGSKADSRYFQAVKKIHDQGRAVNVTTWEGTQDPTNENLPKRSREGNHIRASLVLGTESQARMAVGDSAVDAGAAPHTLRQGLDKGTLVVAGDGIKLAPGQPSVTARTHYIGPEDAETIAQRAKTLRAGTPARPETEEREVDHLADVATVLGAEDRMKSDEVRQRLAQQWPEVYRTWSASDLVQALKPHGAEPRKYNGNQTISRARVLAAIETLTDEPDDATDTQEDHSQ